MRFLRPSRRGRTCFPPGGSAGFCFYQPWTETPLLTRLPLELSELEVVLLLHSNRRAPAAANSLLNALHP